MQCLQTRSSPAYLTAMLTDLIPTTISMQAADRKFFSQNDFSHPSVLAFCHIYNTACNTNNIRNNNRSFWLIKTHSKHGHKQIRVRESSLYYARPEKTHGFIPSPIPPSLLVQRSVTSVFFVSK